MYKPLIAALLLILFAASAAATPNAYALHQLNSTHWYFESTQNDLPEGTHNYTAYANNKSTEYRILVYDITPPASITPLTTTTGNFYHNWTWTNPADADFNHTTIYINGSWITNTSNEYYNLTADAHNQSTISTHTVDVNDNMNSTWVNLTSIIPNNPITITNIVVDWSGNEGERVYVNCIATDADSDTPIFSCSRTDLFADFDTATGTGNWTIVIDDTVIGFGVSDGYGSTDNCTITVQVTPHILTYGTNASLSLAGILPLIAIVATIFSMFAVFFLPHVEVDFEGIVTTAISTIILIVLLYIAIKLCNPLSIMCFHSLAR